MTDLSSRRMVEGWCVAIFEADFLPCSYGFRPKKSPTQALEAIRKAGNRGDNFVVDADIRSYFDGIDRASSWTGSA